MLSISYEGAEEPSWIWTDFLIGTSKGNSPTITYIQYGITWLDINSACSSLWDWKAFKSFF